MKEAKMHNYDNIQHLVNLLEEYDRQGAEVDGVPVIFDNDHYAFRSTVDNCWYVDTACLSCILINRNTLLVSPLRGDEDGFEHVDWLADYLGMPKYVQTISGFGDYMAFSLFLKGVINIRTSDMLGELRVYLKSLCEGRIPGRRFDPTSYDMVGTTYGRIMSDGEWEFSEPRPCVSSDLAGWVVRYFDNIPDTQPLIEADDDTGEADYYQYYYRAAELLDVPITHIIDATDLAVLEKDPVETTLEMLQYATMYKSIPEAIKEIYTTNLAG